jgi:hypothetical protein
MCKFCLKKSVPPGSTTCGGSYCQEASYWENVSRNARRGSRKAREAFEKSNVASTKASPVR